jgi:arylsulfatase A-like enzyme
VTEKVDGKSLMPVILDDKALSQHGVFYWQVGEYNDQNSQWAVRSGPWKLIGNANEPSSDGKKNNIEKLFLVNLDQDIEEQNNLAASNSQKLYELLELHRSWLKSVRLEMNE